MKNIVKASIAGIAFKLEETAYNKLEGYLNRIRSSYGNSPDGEEILSDIEARIAEIILTRQDASVIVPLSLIDSTLAQLGAPEEISEGAPEGTAEKSGEGRKETVNQAPSLQGIPHRLYRNSENAKLGGVCSGLAAYFDVDPVVVRLLFAAPLVLLVFFAIIGWGWLVPLITGIMTCAFILYFLLWIVIPKAKTPLQKLEMKGEKITKDTLEQSFREEFQSRSNDPKNIELRAKNERNASVFSEFVSIIGKILLFCVKAFVAIIGFSFAMAIIGILVAIIAILFGGPGAIHGLSSSSPSLIAILILLAVLIPLGLAVYGILKMLFNFNPSRPFVSTLLVVWVLTLVFGTVILIKDFDNIRFDRNFSIRWNGTDWWTERSSDRRTNPAGNDEAIRLVEPLTIAGDTLYVIPADSTVVIPHNFTVKIRQGNDKYDTPTAVVRKSYRGYESDGNQEYVDQISVEYLMQNDTLFVKPIIPDIAEVENEYAELNLYLPQERTVVVQPGINYNEYLNK